jgi:hypothetical protein
MKILRLIVMLGLIALSAKADFLVPVISSWGIEGAGTGSPYLPGATIAVAVQLMGTRTNPTQINYLDVDVYLSRVSNSFSAPAVKLGIITANIPGSQTQGPIAHQTFVIPATYGGSAITAGRYYIVFSAVGISGSSVQSSAFDVGTPDIAIQQAGISMVDGVSTVSFAEGGIGSQTSRTFFMDNTGSGPLAGVAASIVGANPGDFSVTTAPPASIAIGGSASAIVQFTPTAAGVRNAILRINSNVAGSKNPFDINITGAGVLVPQVTTGTASTVTSTSVILAGSVNAQNSSTAVKFAYGLSTAYGLLVTANPATVSGSVSQPVSGTPLNLLPGTTYHYRISATNGGGNSTGSDMTFTTLTVQQQWRLTNFGSPAATGNAAFPADPNNNGIPNGIEYALGGNPNTFDPNGLSILPVASLNPVANRWVFNFVRYLDRTDLTLTVQAADSAAGPWTDLARSVNGSSFTALHASATASESGAGNSRAVTVSDIYQANDPLHPQRLMRLSVTTP